MTNIQQTKLIDSIGAKIMKTNDPMLIIKLENIIKQVRK